MGNRFTPKEAAEYAVTWDKIKGVDGYKVRYSANEDMSKSKYVYTKTNKITLNLRTGIYFMRVAGYVKIKDKVYTGRYSLRRSIPAVDESEFAKGSFGSRR